MVYRQQLKPVENKTSDKGEPLQSTRPWRCESCHRQQANERWTKAVLQNNFFMDTETWVSYNLHVLEKTILLRICYQPFKDVKTTLHSWATQKQAAGQLWPARGGLRTLGYTRSRHGGSVVGQGVQDIICSWISQARSTSLDGALFILSASGATWKREGTRSDLCF